MMTAAETPSLRDAKSAFDKGDLEEAQRVALGIAQDHQSGPQTVVQAYHFAGIIGLERSQASAARACLRRALVLDPGRAGALANFAQIAETGNCGPAPGDAALRALMLNPASRLGISVLATHYSLAADKLRATHRFAQAYRNSKRALALMPELPAAMRGAVIQRRWLAILDDVRGNLDRAAGILEEIHRTPPLPIQLLAGYASSEAQLRAAVSLRKLMPAAKPRPMLARGRDQRLHIGYVGSYLTGHALATALPEILRHHDRAKLQISVYATPDRNGRTECDSAIEKHADKTTLLSGLDPLGQASALRNDGIDIAIDLDGFLGTPLELFQHAPAPVLVNYFGFPGTCGGMHDYIVGDRTLIPDWVEKFYGEAIVRMPHSYIPFDRDQATTALPSRQDCGLLDDSFVFAAHHSQNKISADSFAAWMSCLERVPDSFLWLLEHSQTHRSNMIAAAERCGIEGSRLIFAPKVSRPQHLARLPLADIYLDNNWYNAHTTAVDALWMGLPFVTCAGSSFAARVGASVLHAAGLPDLIGSSPAEMADIAVGLARSSRRLTAVRRQLAGIGHNAPLFDMKQYTYDLERAFLAMADRSRLGLPPTNITLPPKRRV